MVVPLMIIGATLFALGTYRSLKPEQAQVNQGFVASDQKPSDADKADAAELAAQAAPEADTQSPSQFQLSVTKAPWVKDLLIGALGEFDLAVVRSLQKQQAAGEMNCSPVLTGLAQPEIKKLEEVICTAKDGNILKASFDGSEHGTLEIKSPEGDVVTIEKSETDLRISAEGP
ncbi:hypothetical protein PsB1_0961 [Candidatus Phycosocius spiralis]|uniref:Uncharacterized protein n=1 Tax=Candidatus Phycosocius spiralis TaxID=2815099 RepID=A0ABQ4PUZ1_9PROT|nr:hypothetical protein PsB1_0961 [Candidatus Phycosocius spiralis]